MRFVDLFAGLGGFHLAARELGGECVFASELDEGLRKLYETNFGLRPEGDIRKVEVMSIGAHDLLCAGFPCQPFSKAGDQAGWQDAIRGSVFDRVVDILEVHKPEFVLLENVAHFVNHDRGSSYLRVEGELKNLGYDVDKSKLSPHQFGVPHYRERLFVVARHGGLGGFEFPSPMSDHAPLSIESILEAEPTDAVSIGTKATRCLDLWQDFLNAVPSDAKLPSFPIWGMEFGATYPFDVDSLFDVPLRSLRKARGSFGEPLSRLGMEEILCKVPSHARTKVGTFPTWKKDFIRQNRAFFEEHREAILPLLPRMREFPSSLQKFEWNCQGETRNLWNCLIQFRASGVRVKRATTAPSLVAMTGTQVPIIGRLRRYMSPRECAKLQSMESLKELPKGEKCVAALGNAVNVKVVRLILEKLLRSRAGRESNRSIDSNALKKLPASSSLSREAS